MAEKEIMGIPTADGVMPILQNVVKDLHKLLSEFSAGVTSKWEKFCPPVCASFGHRGDQKDSKYGLSRDALVMTAGVFRQLHKATSLTFSNAQDLLEQIPLLKADQGSIDRNCEYLNRDGKDSKLLLGKDIPIELIKDVRALFTNSFENPKLFSVFKIDKEFLENFIRLAHASINQITQEIGESHGLREDKLFTINAIGFPDHFHPLVTLFEFEVKVYVDTSQQMFEDVDMHGISVDFKSVSYHPELDVINKLKEDLTTQAIDAALVIYETVSPDIETIVKAKNHEIKIPIVTQGGALITHTDASTKYKDALKGHDFKTIDKPLIDEKMCVKIEGLEENSLMHDDTFGTIATVCHVLKKCDDNCFDDFEVLVQTNPVVGNPRHKNIERFDRLYKDGHNVRCVENGKPLKSVVDEVEAWILRLTDIGDEEPVFNINYEDLTTLLEQVCRHHDDMAKTDESGGIVQKTLIEFSCLVFPNDNVEYFQLIKLKIDGFAESRSFNADEFLKAHFKAIRKNERARGTDLPDSEDEAETETKTASEKNVNMDSCGLSGMFYCYKFTPKREKLRFLNEPVRQKITQQGKLLMSM